MTEQPLFDGYTPPSPEPVLSQGRRLTQRQADQIAEGVHPLTLSYLLIRPLHAEADRTRTRDSVDDGTPTCGTCARRLLVWHRGKTYPKCDDLGLDGHGPATDVRAWWPGCTSHKPKAQ